MEDIENAINKLTGLEQLCITLSVSDYTRGSGDAEIFSLFSDILQDVRDVLLQYLEKKR